MEVTSFKSKVCQLAISNASDFKHNYIDYEYLICSPYLPNNHQILRAAESNYLHLIGVNAHIPPDKFFNKCIEQTLVEDDFDFNKKGVASGIIKGAVRDKSKVLINMTHLLYSKDIIMQTNFSKNKITCSLASSDLNCTVGFATSGHPKTLLKGNYLDCSFKPDLILRRTSKSDELFGQIIYGDISNINEYKETLSSLLSKNI